MRKIRTRQLLSTTTTMAASSSSSSSSPIKRAPEPVSPTLPQNMIIDILSRLSVKILCKFKLVSKHWLHIITDPYFILTHRTRSLQKPNLVKIRKISSDEGNGNTQIKKTTRIELCTKDFDGNRSFDLTLDENDDIDVLPSEWDFICFAGVNGLYVCNPSTQEMVKLPESSCCTSGDVVFAMGYVLDRNEYIFIHLFDRSLDMNIVDTGCEILRLTDGCSVNDCSWKVVAANCPYDVRGWGVLVENVFFWMIWDEYHPEHEAIVYFDLEKEEFGTVSPPEGWFDPEGLWYLMEWRGCLCLVDHASRASQPLITDIWVLKDFENHRWVKDYIDNELAESNIPLDQSFKRMDNPIAGDWKWYRIYKESFFSLVSR